MWQKVTYKQRETNPRKESSRSLFLLDLYENKQKSHRALLSDTPVCQEAVSLQWCMACSGWTVLAREC